MEKVNDHMSIIEVNGLTKDYGFERGVFDISFCIEKGEVFGFLGPNGAGKSTAIRHLMGFSKPDKGNTKIFGKETFEKYSEILSSVGYIPGEIALPVGLSGWEFLRMMQNLQKVYKEDQLKKMLELFKLEDNVLICETKRMSLGVKRKLAIVSAFMNDPDVLILDEPTSGLDPVMQETFIRLIKSEKARGKTILLSSHIFSEVDETCDRIAIIKDGHIVSEFIANDLKHAKTKMFQIEFIDKKEACVFIDRYSDCKSLKIMEANKENASVLISTQDENINETVDILSGFNIKEFCHQKETLEDYFMKYYKEDKDFGGALNDRRSHQVG
jgi:ABC-2 type transport system ATP-binding protein